MPLSKDSPRDEHKNFAEPANNDGHQRGGLVVHDVSQPERPREIAHWACGGTGVHRFTFDGRFAYISPEVDGYIGNIVMILDLERPDSPQEVGRWWMPGQRAGGAVPSCFGRTHPRIVATTQYGPATGSMSAIGAVAA